MLQSRRAVYVSALAAAARAVPGTTVIHPSTVFCEARTCLFTLDGQPAYTDDKHLTQAAEGLLFRSFAEEFRWAIEGHARGEARHRAANRIVAGDVPAVVDPVSPLAQRKL
jgi:hypothetical protein